MIFWLNVIAITFDLIAFGFIIATIISLRRMYRRYSTAQRSGDDNG